LLYCYHYDPQSGRYRSVVGEMMMAGGLLTLTLLGGYIGLSLWRERRA
jgi:protein SCO1/2